MATEQPISIDAPDISLARRPRVDPRLQAILDSFDYHRPSAEQGERIETNRRAFKLAAMTVIETTPVGPDQTAALRQLHEAMMTANKAIACEPGTPRVPLRTPPDDDPNPGV